MKKTGLFKLRLVLVITTITFLLSLYPLQVLAIEKSQIFPIPSEVQINEGKFNIDLNTFIMVPEKESKTDDFLASLMINEFAGKYEKSIVISKKQGLY